MGCLHRFMGYLHSHRCARGRAAFITFYYFLPHWLDPIISWKSDRDSALAYLPKVPSCISTLYSCSVFLLSIPAQYSCYIFQLCILCGVFRPAGLTAARKFGPTLWSKTLKQNIEANKKRSGSRDERLHPETILAFRCRTQTSTTQTSALELLHLVHHFLRLLLTGYLDYADT